MQISIILAHPNEESFNHAIALTAVETVKRNGHRVLFHDLYKENFYPILSMSEIPKDALIPQEIERHCNEIFQADGIIIIHPNWWGQPPAILKGWVDRVLRPGVAYEFIGEDQGEGVPNGLLKAESVIVFNTSNTETEREKNVFGDPLETIWKNCIFSLCGVNNFYRHTFNIMVVSTKTQRKQWLQEVQRTIDRIYP